MISQFKSLLLEAQYSHNYLGIPLAHFLEIVLAADKVDAF